MLRVPSAPQPTGPLDGGMGGDMGMPPMDGGMPMGDGAPMEQGMDPQMDMGMGQPGDMGGGNPFDSNFDPGVEADEETDPKRFIQQLTGKLSQSLRSYNDSLPSPDVDLSKYVAGMILKQSLQNVPQDEIGELIKNAENGGDEEDTLGESVERLSDMHNTETETMPSEKPGKAKRKGYRRSAFTAPDFT